MPDRYGDRDANDWPEVPPPGEPVVDFESRRSARDAIAKAAEAEDQRKRLAESRTVHAPLDRGQSDAARQHRQAVTERADAHRNALRIANCGLCDDDGYNAARRVCDHVDRSGAYERGMAAVREAMGWDA